MLLPERFWHLVLSAFGILWRLNLYTYAVSFSVSSGAVADSEGPIGPLLFRTLVNICHYCGLGCCSACSLITDTDNIG